jgi:hypothetical protein
MNRYQFEKSTGLKASEILLIWESMRGKLGDMPAMSAIAKTYGLKSHDIKNCIKWCTKKPRLTKAAKEFAGKVTSKQCDELWAQVVKKRAGYKCERSGDTRNLQAHHIIPKSVSSALRYDLINGCCLTKANHLYWAHRDSVGFSEWIETKRNIEYLKLKRHNRSKHDYAIIKLYLEGELKKLK